MTSNGPLPVLFGASVTGPHHLAGEQLNQDAWLTVRGHFGALAVVCDGLGSRPHSRFGARAACRAVRQAAHYWSGSAAGADPADLVRLIEALWRLGVASYGSEACATTCLFVLREPGGILVTAGLGDGALLVTEAGAAVRRFGGRDGAVFGNETLALGVRHSLRDWWFQVWPPCAKRTVVLASDGVADDLDPERLDGFVGWLTDELVPLPGRQRRRRLQTELRRWPVPNHTDDKTLAVMMETEKEKND